MDARQFAMPRIHPNLGGIRSRAAEVRSKPRDKPRLCQGGETNYYAVVRVTQAFSPALTRNGRAGIINVLSDASWLPVPILTPHSVTKAAAWSFANHVRADLKEQNIQVLGLHVGFADTDLTKGINVPKARPGDVAPDTFVP
jgi:short-subunit dehydrogenase